jgi:hypothetical protein
MTSPFPGMDPYIEACGLWEDFHRELIAEIKHVLIRAASERYLVRTRERCYAVLVDHETKTTHPAPRAARKRLEGTRKSAPTKGGTPASKRVFKLEPVVMRAFAEEEHREGFVEIYENTPEPRLVTCIEVLSPSNKQPGSPGWELYLRKRQSALLGDASLLEIDLLRGGQRMPMVDTWPDSPYTCLVSRREQDKLCQVWPVYFQIPCPSLPVPLAQPDPDILLTLQPMIDSVYKRSGYKRSIDYETPLCPPLKGAETAWLKKRLRSRLSRA